MHPIFLLLIKHNIIPNGGIIQKISTNVWGGIIRVNTYGMHLFPTLIQR